jgi:hypothetical protein
MTEQGTSSAPVGINLSGSDGALVAKRGEAPLFAVEPDTPGLPLPFSILSQYADRTKVSGIKFAPYRENLPLIEATVGEAMDKLMEGTYVNPGCENCPGDIAFQTILYGLASPEAPATADGNLSAGSAYIATAGMQKMFVLMAEQYKKELALGLSIDNPTSLQNTQYQPGTIFPSADAVTYAQQLPNYSSNVVTAAQQRAKYAEFAALKDEVEHFCPLSITSTDPTNTDPTDIVTITWHVAYQWLFLVHVNAMLVLSGLDPAVEVLDEDAGTTFQAQFDSLNAHMMSLVPNIWASISTAAAAL